MLDELFVDPGTILFTRDVVFEKMDLVSRLPQGRQWE